MKQSLLLICVLLSITLATAQQNEKPVQVPAEVTKSLQEKFPEASGVEWSQKKEKYKAKFKVAKIKHEVWLDKTGVVSKHQYEIKKAELPKAVIDAVAKDYSAYTAHDCERADENGVTTYKVELKSAGGKKKVTFSADGKVIPKNDD
ncbi:MAG TPA: PepSY-like domain-containing protein [Cyclobacteriaceae bacterium]|nr:PepSY-like domain-containing protein [Cyclobacteriaceae bacterium]